MIDHYEVIIRQNVKKKEEWCWDNLNRNDWFISSRIGLSATFVFTEDAAMAYKLRWV